MALANIPNIELQPHNSTPPLPLLPVVVDITPVPARVW